MDANGDAKSTGIRQTVRLKELIQKWQSAMLRSNEAEGDFNFFHAGISPIVSKRIKNMHCACDSDEDGGSPCAEPPPDVPKGYLAVYVGPELRRFIIPTSYLSHDLFKVLLEKAEEEFGFDHHGGLTIPCEIEIFKYLLKCMEKESQQKDVSDNNLEKQDQL